MNLRRVNLACVSCASGLLCVQVCGWQRWAGLLQVKCPLTLGREDSPPVFPPRAALKTACCVVLLLLQSFLHPLELFLELGGIVCLCVCVCVWVSIVHSALRILLYFNLFRFGCVIFKTIIIVFRNRKGNKKKQKTSEFLREPTWLLCTKLTVYCTQCSWEECVQWVLESCCIACNEPPV